MKTGEDRRWQHVIWKGEVMKFYCSDDVFAELSSCYPFLELSWLRKQKDKRQEFVPRCQVFQFPSNELELA